MLLLAHKNQRRKPVLIFLFTVLFNYRTTIMLVATQVRGAECRPEAIRHS